MTAIAYFFALLALLIAVLLAIAVVKLDRSQTALHAELEAHDETRTQFGLIAWEADRNAERVADLEWLVRELEISHGAAVIDRANALSNLALVLGEERAA